MMILASSQFFNDMKKRTDPSLWFTLDNIIYYVANKDGDPTNITPDDYQSAYGDGSVKMAFPVLGSPPSFLADPTNQLSNTFFKHYQLWGKVSEFISASLLTPKIIPEEYVLHLSCCEGVDAGPVAYPPNDVPEKGYFTRPQVVEGRLDGSKMITVSEEVWKSMNEQAAKDAAAKPSDQ